MDWVVLDPIVMTFLIDGSLLWRIAAVKLREREMGLIPTLGDGEVGAMPDFTVVEVDIGGIADK